MASAKKAGGGEAVPSLKEIVADLGPRRVKLDDLDVKLLEVVKALEEKLRERVSTRVSIVVEVTPGPGYEWVEMLTFGKHDGQWMLLIEAGEHEGELGLQNLKKLPLATASRQKRALMFTGGFIEKLVREAAKQLDDQIAEREEAMKIATKLIDALDVDDDFGGQSLDEEVAP